MPSFSQAFNELRNGANAYYSASLLFTLPLANITARNAYKGGKVAKHQASLVLTKLQQDVITQVDNAVKTVQYTYQQVGATRKAREFAEAALDAQTKRLLAGEATPFLVLEFQRNVTAARTAELLALADFNKAKAQLAFSEGSTLDSHKIDLKVH
jgi:outer membrane protein TolC